MKYEIEKLKEIKKSLCDVDITSESIIEDLNNKISEYENVLQSLKENRGIDTNELHVKIENLKLKPLILSAWLSLSINHFNSLRFLITILSTK